jgi:peptide/nickel transport system substrate-binding protein
MLMRAYERQIVEVEAHEFPMLWWNRIVAYQSYVKGWKIGPSHYINQDLATIWLDK